MAGYFVLYDIVRIICVLDEVGVDLIEVGMFYFDLLVDGLMI